MATPERCPSQDDKVLLFGLLSDTCARLERRVDSDLKSECDLPLAWFETLLSLRRSPSGRLTMSEIADETAHSTGGATRLVDRLVSAELVERISCPTDRRAIHVTITGRGNDALDRALARHVDVLQTAVGESLSNEERVVLHTLLTKLRQSL
ncbi:MAG: MarR family transcriptional regulator [Acidobacteria bacterium]|nr:MarR family transcriptional regulator [Acidobacteriota bacterium]